MDGDLILSYLRPELIVLVVVLYFIGTFLKKSEAFKDELIPLVLGILSIVLCTIYVVSVSTFTGYQSVCAGILDILIQGVLCAAGAVYANQMYKQMNRLNSTDASQS